MSEFKKGLKSFEDLYKTGTQLKNEQDQSGSSQGIQEVLINQLEPFSKHPFKGYTEDKLNDLAESIKKYGVIVPILIRPIKADKLKRYEIIAGHNRVRACIKARIPKIPCNIQDVDDDTAVIMMIDTNLQQRETILPSEKAFAYKYKFEAIKSKGKRNDLTSSQVATKLQTDEVIAKENNESKHTMYRYIRLTHLIPELLDKVDERKIPFIPAVDLSYLSEDEQNTLKRIMVREEHFNITMKQSSKLKAISQKGNLTNDKIQKVLSENIKSTPSKIKVSYSKIKEYLPNNFTPRELENRILEALELWAQKNKETLKKEKQNGY